VLTDWICSQAKKHYEKAFRDAEKAQEAYKKAEQDINLSKAEIEKVPLSALFHSFINFVVFVFF